MSEESFDEKLERFKQDRIESNKRINKMLAERDPNRNNRYFEKRNILLRDYQLEHYHLDNLEAELAKVKAKMAALKSEIEQLDSNHGNNLDHCWMYSDLREGSDSSKVEGISP